MYRNQRLIFTPFFLNPIKRTLKTEGRGRGSLKFRGGGGTRSLKGCEIARDLAQGRIKSLGISPRGDGQMPGGRRNPCDTGTLLTTKFPVSRDSSCIRNARGECSRLELTRTLARGGLE